MNVKEVYDKGLLIVGMEFSVGAVTIKIDKINQKEETIECTVNSIGFIWNEKNQKISHINPSFELQNFIFEGLDI